MMSEVVTIPPPPSPGTGAEGAPDVGADPVRRPAAPTSQDVYERLRLGIVSGDIRPNAPLIEADLASALAVSRTPIRESLQRLAADGLIVPRKRGWAVREYSLDEIRENYELRAGLEGYAAALAAERMSADALAQLVAIHTARIEAVAPSRAYRVSSNRAFHDTILAGAQNQRLAEAVYRAGQFYFNQRVAGLTTEAEMKANEADHGRIVAALSARDPRAAEAASRAHILHAFEIMYRGDDI